MDKRSISRINMLTRISRERALTPEETAERETLRSAYIRAFRGQMRAQLDNTVVEYPDGNRSSLRDAAKKKN